MQTLERRPTGNFQEVEIVVHDREGRKMREDLKWKLQGHTDGKINV